MIRQQVDLYGIPFEEAVHTAQGCFLPPGEQSFMDDNAAKDFAEKMPRLEMFASVIE